jgi:hypothetical protein
MHTFDAVRATISGLLMVLFLVGLGGCSSQTGQRHVARGERAVERAALAGRARSELVGRSKGDILACAGTPVATQNEGALEVLEYQRAGEDDHPWFSRECKAKFTFEAGRLTRLDYEGWTGGPLTRGEQCAFVVRSCMPQ